MSILISIEKLLSGKIVEGTRMELKRGWNPTPIMRSICAFANDFENEGSGYIIVGVEEKDGKPLRPVKGFNPNDFERIQKELIGYCNLIQPLYTPRLSLEEIDGKHVLVIWSPAGTNRPYKVPDDILAKKKIYNYRIRQFSSSIIPKGDQETELIQLTAKIPFDDRVNTLISVNELSFGLMREHLAKTGSKLFKESATMNIEELSDKMNLCQGAKEHLFPKNVGLLMFSENTNVFFKGVQIDVVEFPEGLGAKEFKENTFIGTIQKQLSDVLSYLKTHIVKSKVIKYADRAESDTIFNYPYEAIEEALSNAVYHRNYELLDPIEVRVLPTTIEIISYSGIDPSLKQSDFDKGVIKNRRYRNRRIGEFLKELNLTEGKGTGIPTMIRVLNRNGSAAPKFDTNEPERSSFITELLIHPDFPIVKDEAIDSSIDKFKEIQNNFGLISDRILLGKEKNIDFLRGIFGVFSEYFRTNFGVFSDEIRAKSGERSLFILELMALKPDITRKNIVDILSVSLRTIDKNIKLLRDCEVIARIGSDKAGHWEIVDKRGKT